MHAFPSRTAAVRLCGINPKLANERVTKREWPLEQTLELESRSRFTYAKRVVIVGAEYPSLRQVTK
ncbi:conserved hypothetical protein [Vibrio coralliirubri]|nr:conserved hypothetical protein [Vibrio coralliirubri]